MSQRLLVVEDSKPIATVIKQIAQSLNYDVVVATTLAQVEEILSGDTDFFAATVDYALPDALDGEAIACVLSNGIPSIVMTGKMDDATRQKILAQPVIDYIPKENSQAFLYLKRVLHWQKTNNKNAILVVDDSSSARNHIVELLKRRNFRVHTANNGIQALEKLQQHNNIKMVVTDLEMPEMDGITLTNEIRKKYSREQLAIIGISGAENGIHSARFIKNGADGVMQFVNPQKIVVSPNGKFLYIACSGSNSIVVFHKVDTGQYAFLQAINNSDIGGSGLEGASSLAISSDGSRVYSAGDSGIGLYFFGVGDNGRLSFKNKLLSVRDNELKKISSITLTSDNRHLLVATGKDNSLFVFKIKTR